MIASDSSKATVKCVYNLEGEGRSLGHDPN